MAPLPAHGIRVLPWADWEEWRAFRAAILQGDFHQAAELAALHQFRRAGSVPYAMQSTYELASLRAAEDTAAYGNGLESSERNSHERRLALAMAIVRLVNAATDGMQPRGDGAVARSVHSLAKALNMPPSLVEVRHEATHSTLPEMNTLLSVTDEALVWLENEYWQPQENAIQGMEREQEVQKEDFGSMQTREDESNAEKSAHRQNKDVGNKEEGKEECATVGKRVTERRKRWRTSYSPMEWENVPLGLLPGQKRLRSLIGIDVSRFIGISWTPDGAGTAANDSEIGDAQEASGEFRTDSENAHKDTNADAGDEPGEPEGADSGRAAACARSGVRVERRLTDREKAAVEEMMRGLLQKRT